MMKGRLPSQWGHSENDSAKDAAHIVSRTTCPGIRQEGWRK